MLLVANLANAKWCKNPEKWLKHCHMGTHLRVLSESYLMSTNMTGFGCFTKIFASLRFWIKVASARGWTELTSKSASPIKPAAVKKGTPFNRIPSWWIPPPKCYNQDNFLWIFISILASNPERIHLINSKWKEIRTNDTNVINSLMKENCQMFVCFDSYANYCIFTFLKKDERLPNSVQTCLWEKQTLEYHWY